MLLFLGGGHAAGAEPAHTAQAEIAEVQAFMQAGEYRRALSLAAHTAGEHPSVESRSLYAQLLDLGGQTAIATKMLPHPPVHFAPASADSARLPKELRLVSSGVLVGERRAIAPISTETTLWVRNGLGAISSARVVQRTESVSILELERPLVAPALAVPGRAPFPGSPGYVAGYAQSADAAPDWPLLRAGFVGKRSRLYMQLPPGPRGGPVLDAAGRLLGIAVAGTDGADVLLPVSALQLELTKRDAPPAERASFDEVYERVLAVTLQVLAAR